MGKRGVGFYWKLAFTNLKGNRRVYLPYLLSSVGIIMMFYSINALGQGIDQGALYGGTTVASMMGLGVFVIGLFAVLFLFYTNSFIIKRRKKELGLYNILGMEKRHIAHILFRETLLIAVCSLALGLGLGIVFSRVLFWLLGLLLGTDLAVAFVIPVSAITSTLGLFGLIFLLTLCYNLLQVKLSKPIELLHGGETGEREPKAHWFLAVLGALLLGTGYTMAVTIQDPLSALVFFFVAVILVILGTYLLFITGITAMLKLLKKNKRFYYKTNHFTALSGMLFRMKQNAAGLASICVLFTALLVTVSTTFSLYTSMDGLLRARYPRNVLVSAQAENQDVQELVRTAVEKETQALGIQIENVVDREGWEITTARVGDTLYTEEQACDAYAVIDIFTEEEFERFSGETIDLSSGQVLFFDPRNTFPGESTLTIDHQSFEMVSSNYAMPEASTMAQIYEMYYLVVKDEAVVDSIFASSGAYAEPNYSFDFDVVGGDPESIVAIKDALVNALFYDRPKSVGHFSCMIEDSVSSRQSFMELYGGLFFLGLFLGVLFLLGTALIIYYKQVSEGYDDARRFNIMQKVGMSHREVKQSIHSQILLVFFLPLVTAVLHLAFAFPMLQKILLVMGLNNFPLILCSTLGCVGVFAVAYLVIYALTARTYYNIVESAS